jgi:hypothetical protein
MTDCLNIAQLLPSFVLCSKDWLRLTVQIGRFHGRSGAKLHHCALISMFFKVSATFQKKRRAQNGLSYASRGHVRNGTPEPTGVIITPVTRAIDKRRHISRWERCAPSQAGTFSPELAGKPRLFAKPRAKLRDIPHRYGEQMRKIFLMFSAS